MMPNEELSLLFILSAPLWKVSFVSYTQVLTKKSRDFPLLHIVFLLYNIICLFLAHSGQGVLLEGKLLDVSRHVINDVQNQKVRWGRYQHYLAFCLITVSTMQYTRWEEVSFFILQFKIKVKNVKNKVEMLRMKLKNQEQNLNIKKKVEILRINLTFQDQSQTLDFLHCCHFRTNPYQSLCFGETKHKRRRTEHKPHCFVICRSVTTCCTSNPAASIRGSLMPLARK